MKRNEIHFDKGHEVILLHKKHLEIRARVTEARRNEYQQQIAEWMWRTGVHNQNYNPLTVWLVRRYVMSDAAPVQAIKENDFIRVRS